MYSIFNDNIRLKENSDRYASECSEAINAIQNSTDAAFKYTESFKLPKISEQLKHLEIDPKEVVTLSNPKVIELRDSLDRFAGRFKQSDSDEFIGSKLNNISEYSKRLLLDNAKVKELVQDDKKVSREHQSISALFNSTHNKRKELKDEIDNRIQDIIKRKRFLCGIRNFIIIIALIAVTAVGGFFLHLKDSNPHQYKKDVQIITNMM